MVRYHVNHVPNKVITNCMGVEAAEALASQGPPQLGDIPPAPSRRARREAHSELDTGSESYARMKSCANWFYWVGALSMVNALVLMFNGEWNFVVGLGTIQIIGAIAQFLSSEIGNMPLVIGLAMNTAIASLVGGFGWVAGKGHAWVFMLGLILYGCDTLFFLLAGDFLSLIFHAFVLYKLVVGFKAARALRRESASIGGVAEAAAY